jgi:hypothetical protein
MPSYRGYEIPDFGSLLGNLLGAVETERRPLLMALLERVAAGQYREWASLPECGAHRADLLACAAREEEIAGSIEGLYPDAAELQGKLQDQLPQLSGIAEALFGDRSLRHQFAVLAAGERGGAQIWTDLASNADSAPQREGYAACAPLEEANATVLDRLLDEA